MPEQSIQVVQAVHRRKWAGPVLDTLHDQPLRYTDIVRSLTLSTAQTLHPHTLTDTLRWLERCGLVAKCSEGRSSMYHLTDPARRLVGIMADLNELDRQLDGSEAKRQ